MDLDEEARLRREKMTQLKKHFENDAFRDHLTSAPSIVHVDEFHEELSIAERKKREAERQRLNANAPNKQRFFMELNKKGPDPHDATSNLHTNALIAESSRRSQDHLANKKLDQDIESIFSDDPEISTISGRLTNFNANSTNNSDQEYSLAREADMRRANAQEKFQAKSWNSQDHDHEMTVVGEHADAYGKAHLLEQNRFSNNVQNGIKDRGKDRPGSHKTKIYDDGQYVDAGYDSISTNGSSMPTFPHNSNNQQLNNKRRNSVSVNNHSDLRQPPIGDPLSQSLQEWKLRKMTQPDEDSKIKCVYDARMFSNNHEAARSPHGRRLFDSDTEAEYFSQMNARNNTKTTTSGGSKINSEKRNTFREFLSNSFNKAHSNKPNKNSKISNNALDDSQASTVTISGVHMEEPWMTKTNSNFTNNKTRFPIDENEEMVDCIDLKNENKMRRSQSPDNYSVQTLNTEFGDPDRNGHAKKLARQNGRPKSVAQRSRDFLSSSFPGLMLFINGFSGGAENQQNNTDNRSSTKNENFDCCDHCGRNEKKKRGISCATLLFLLAIDAFTIALLLILFYNLKHWPGPPPYPYTREGRINKDDNPYFDRRTSNGRNFDENTSNFDGKVDSSNPGISISVGGTPVVMSLPPNPIGSGRGLEPRGLPDSVDENDQDVITEALYKSSNASRRDQRNVILRRTVQVEESDQGAKNKIRPVILPASSRGLNNTLKRNPETDVQAKVVPISQTSNLTATSVDVNPTTSSDELLMEYLENNTEQSSVGRDTSKPNSSSLKDIFQIMNFKNIVTTPSRTAPDAFKGGSQESGDSKLTPVLELTTFVTQSSSVPSTSKAVKAFRDEVSGSTIASSSMPTATSTSRSAATSPSTSVLEESTATRENSLPMSVQQLTSDVEGIKHPMEYDVNQALLNLTKEVANLKRELDILNHPPAFACHRTEPFAQEGIVTFSSCNVLTDGMSPGTGIFTVRIPGVYQLSFTGLFHILNGHQIDADIIRQTPDGRFSNLGRSSADTNEIATFFVQGTDDDLMISTTMMTMVRLNIEDKIYVETRLSEGHGKSMLKSTTSDPSIHFVGHRIGF